MRLFKWKEHQKKWRNHPPIFMFIFFVERKSINGGKSPNVYVYVFFFVGKIPYQWRFIARWENPRDEI